MQGHEIGLSVRSGDRSQPPLVLCNGIGASLKALAPLVDALRTGREVIRFDVPGTGSSPAPVIPYSMAWMAHILGELLDRLGHDRADVLGYSWGGALAQQFALQNPVRCRKVVLLCTMTGVIGFPGQLQALSRMVTPRRHRDGRYAERVAGRLYGGTMRTRPGPAGKALGARTRAASRRGYLYQLMAGAGWTSTPFLPLMRQRTLILAGDDDPIIPVRNGRMMKMLLPHATLRVLPGGHLDPLTHPAPWARLIDAFLDSERSR
ncbi:alpha/beta fold hydrolase [Flexivirga caeni]|uniref:alpha/beta fold hydrolase n=1 Tax=Flexivirga caeni TaxID=2294115 RepID=UPI001FE80939|nr:alpha/beta fold hydrolase [Flexivirga caeni]